MWELLFYEITSHEFCSTSGFKSQIVLASEMWITEMTILLTLSVYQLMVRDQLPNKSGTIPIIGQLLMYINYAVIC